MKNWSLLLIVLALAGCSSAIDDMESEVDVKETPTEVLPSPSGSSSSSNSSSSSGSPSSSSSGSSSGSSSSSSSGAWTESQVHAQVVQSVCVNCHKSGSPAGSTALLFSVGSSNAIETSNLNALDGYVLSMGGRWVLDKARGLNDHGGGQQLASGSDAYATLVDYLEQVTGEIYSAYNVEAPAYSIEEPAVTYRRASLLLTGVVPSAEKLASLEGISEAGLRAEILNLMQGEGFREFLKRGANDQLLVRSLILSRILRADFQYYYPVFREKYRLEDGTDYEYMKAVMVELAEAPLELIAHVVQNDRPYTEVLTANYTMVSNKTADIYKTGLTPAVGEYVPAVNKGQHVSGTSKRLPSDDWDSSRQVTIPHAGILTEPAFLQQYPTTATNRNRARSRWTYMHFLGFDIEGSAARTVSASALKDIDNPTLNNDACTVCHTMMDPVAGAFQNFSERGTFRAGPFGTDSLDSAYKKTTLYTSGDIWYSDMLAPGFKDALIGSRDAAVQELAQHIVADSRFAPAAVKFWWPALFGEPMLGDGLSYSQYNAKSRTLHQLSEAFSQSNFNVRSLLADMVMSDWFRAGALEEAGTPDAAVELYTGGRRLLTPEELANKTASLTGIYDSQLVTGMNVMYGGIDSLDADKRLREMSHMMSRVAERHALVNACTIVATEFNQSLAERKLFTLVTRKDMPGPARSENIVLADTENTSLRYAVDVKHAEGQAIHYSVTTLKNIHAEYVENNVAIYNVEVIKPDGSVLVSGDPRELYKTHDVVTGTPAGAYDGPYYIRKGFVLNIDFPVDVSGEYQINLTVSANTAGNHLDVSLTPTVFFADASDDAGIKLRQQIAQLIERMHGENLPISSPKILAYTQLFLDLRGNKIRRGAHSNLVETDTRCNYDSGGIARSVWGADPHHTLTAWRGVITMLMTDFGYLYE